ncbi:TetR/AcrR family transcriptional regulator [Paenibacillus sp. CAA11]|uniref:TetR/AcrR family transcriptional regulator n=1 Tax=Paenibacillus sp. CAA11 TaxID=1532905 RepID=UPI001F45274F|nr:TetR/AcrR family transcriptional regulator [Paenibacillus sp. CAA11]
MNDKAKPSFIAGARREQIIEAAIKTLDEIGYVKTSLSQIAKRAGISTALISYHFSDKHDLMDQLLTRLIEMSTAYIKDSVSREQNSQAQLDAFIRASLTYQHTYPERSTALVEIVFHVRTSDHVPYYKLQDDSEDEQMALLRSILSEGQKKGEFGSFHIDVLASFIQGAIGEYMLHTGITKKVSLEVYATQLIHIVNRAMQC